ncbi:MAG: PQQ-dependent sugar dehydrogenase [Acidobacteriia bacterium]|nr:PQQ-dependent sugar dehydrogenase [Terriglobia bacterium]
MWRKRGVFLALWVALFALATSGCGGGFSSQSAPPPGTPPAVALTTIATGLNSPVDLQTPDDNSGRMFVVEQSGTIRIIANNALLPTPFLNIATKVTFSGEMGLLGAAFHPAFSQNQKFYLNYVHSSGGVIQSFIAEYQVSAADPNQADPASERILLTVDQPYDNHKGGQLAFGPDGFLYIGLGDGGSGGDPLGNGQSLDTLLGKMLRIDIDHASGGKNYAIPPDNPFVGTSHMPEIWAYGLRNPWRFSFERSTGRLFCADVGQDNYEEIDLLQKGGNFGWNVMEGMHCYNASNCDMNGLLLPIAEYSHSEGVAVIGGYVYTGKAISGLAGMYVLGDYGSGTIWTLQENPPGTWTRAELLSTGRNLSSFGQDAAGEIYVLDLAGNVLKLVPQ